MFAEHFLNVVIRLFEHEREERKRGSLQHTNNGFCAAVEMLPTTLECWLFEVIPNKNKVYVGLLNLHVMQCHPHLAYKNLTLN
ncbi:hypothetical protein ACLKA7_009394 [Drosophila subpalustris]